MPGPKKKIPKKPTLRQQGESAWERLSYNDRWKVISERSKPENKGDPYGSVLKKLAGQPGAYTTTPKSDIRNARTNPPNAADKWIQKRRIKSQQKRKKKR